MVRGRRTNGQTDERADGRKKRHIEVSAPPKNKINKQKTIQKKTTTTYNSPHFNHRWRCYQATALNDQHVGPTPFTPLSP